MANNLISKGHKLLVFDLVKPALESAVAAGAIKAESPSQVQYCAQLYSHTPFTELVSYR